MSFQERFQERANTGLDRMFGVTVQLAHGEWTTEPFVARWSDHAYDVADAEGLMMTIHARDFEFDVASAVFLGARFEPRRMDQITFEENGVSLVFELQPVGTLPACEILPGGYRYRVHTKQVS